ncbi:RHS repeat-associated core domain-containing protein [Sporosalibacterium faouarense]|uniref:RHS repeat-associated core domain-containing protein n=1 Tax=Sporosalibacterium faouarense TaxID=516123 RepID=UPI003C76275B
MFGNEINQDFNDTNPFRYSGEYYDKETGTYYLRARYYDPSIGRFISEDSYTGKLTDPLSLNLYTYCWNNPIRYVDPSGNAPVTLLYLYLTYVASSPDTHIDMEMMSYSILQGDY